MKRPSQRITSAATSINASKVPAIFPAVRSAGGFHALNLDYGGGRFDTAATYLQPLTENMVYDPYNREPAHNAAVKRRAHLAETATISNVLNVIQEEAARRFAVLEAQRMIKRGGVVYVTIYEGDRSGRGRETAQGYQLNQPISFYQQELERWGFNVSRKGPLLIIK